MWHPQDSEASQHGRWTPVAMAIVFSALFAIIVQVASFVWFTGQLTEKVNSNQVQNEQILKRLDTISGRMQNVEATQKDQTVQLNALIAHAIENQK